MTTQLSLEYDLELNYTDLRIGISWQLLYCLGVRGLRQTGALLAIGGNEERNGEASILREFVRCSGGNRARIAFMAVGADKDSSTGSRYARTFRRMGAEKVNVIKISRRSETVAAPFLEVIQHATGIFFSGGNQLDMTALLGGTPIDEAIHRQYEAGVIVGGTSAGAALMSDAIIVRGDATANPRLGNVEMGPGLQLILGVIIDTHFSQRGRHGRLISAVSQYPHVLGLGIDENTAILIEGDEFRVIGECAVTVIDAASATYTSLPRIRKDESLALHNICVHILSHGCRFNLSKRQPIVEESNISSDGHKPRTRVSTSVRKRQVYPHS